MPWKTWWSCSCQPTPAPVRNAVGEPGLDLHRRQRGLKGAQKKGRAALVGQHQRLLGRKTVAAGVGVVGDVAARGIGVEPLTNVALGGAGLRRELRRCQRLGVGQGLVQPQLFTDHRQDSLIRAAVVDNCPSEQLIESCFVDRHGATSCDTVGCVSHRRQRSDKPETRSSIEGWSRGLFGGGQLAVMSRYVSRIHHLSDGHDPPLRWRKLNRGLVTQPSQATRRGTPGPVDGPGTPNRSDNDARSGPGMSDPWY